MANKRPPASPALARSLPPDMEEAIRAVNEKIKPPELRHWDYWIGESWEHYEAYFLAEAKAYCERIEAEYRERDLPILDDELKYHP